MRRFVKVAALCALGVLGAVSCAKQNVEAYDQTEMRSMDAWMRQNVSGGYETLKPGLYMVRVESHPDAKPVEADKWVELGYTLTDMLKGDVYATRYPQTAKVEGTWTVKTHYTPELLPFATDNYSIMTAMYEALRSMRAGDSVVVYAHSNYTFGSSASTYSGGYQGQSSNTFPGNIPSIIYLKLTNVWDNASDRESGMVDTYALDSLGMQAADTIYSHQFVKILDPKPGAAQIAQDSTVYVYYVTKFTDGFVVDTNIDSVALSAWNMPPSSYAALTVKIDTTSTTYVKGWYNALKSMRYGERAETVFSSTYGYGASGDSSGSTVIQPYEPLVMWLYVKEN